MPTEPTSAVATSKLIEEIMKALVGSVKGPLVRGKQKLEVKFRKGFSHFIKENTAGFSSVKTIISSSTPAPLNVIDVLPVLPSFIRRVCSGYAPVWGVLQTPLV